MALQGAPKLPSSQNCVPWNGKPTKPIHTLFGVVLQGHKQGVALFWWTPLNEKVVSLLASD